VQALIALRLRQWAVVEDSLEEGLALARAMPYPYAEGRLHTERGEFAVARERLEAALILFQRLGARQDASWTAQLLTTLAERTVDEPSAVGRSAAVSTSSAT